MNSSATPCFFIPFFIFYCSIEGIGISFLGNQLVDDLTLELFVRPTAAAAAAAAPCGPCYLSH